MKMMMSRLLPIQTQFKRDGSVETFLPPPTPSLVENDLGIDLGKSHMNFTVSLTHKEDNQPPSYEIRNMASFNTQLV